MGYNDKMENNVERIQKCREIWTGLEQAFQGTPLLQELQGDIQHIGLLIQTAEDMIVRDKRLKQARL